MKSYLKQYESPTGNISRKRKPIIRKYKAGSRSTMAKSREKQLAKIERLTPPTDAPDTAYCFSLCPYRHKHWRLENNTLRNGYDKPLLSPIDLTIATVEKNRYSRV